MRWIKSHIDELIEKKIRSGIEIKKNNYKAIFKQFAEYMETVA